MQGGPPSAGLSTGLRFGIFADDLTGALDAAAPFVVRGLSAYASLTATLPAEFSIRGVAVASVNMDSRRLPPSQAAERAYTAVSDLVEEGYRPAFNKVDSTLRGHTGLEATVAARAGAARGILFCPAFPANERTVMGGQVLVGGVPVDRTDVGRDQLSPVESSDIVETIRRNCGVQATRLGLDVVRQGAAAVIHRLEQQIPPHGMAAVAADAETDEDLRVLASAGLMKEPEWLLAGSGGIAAAVAAYLVPGVNRLAPASAASAPETSDGASAGSLATPPFLVVVGSQRKVAAEAARSLEKSDGSRLVPVDGGRLLDRRESHAEARIVARETAGHLKAGRSVTVLLDAGDVEGPAGRGAGDAADDRRASLAAARDTLVAGLGEIVSAVVAERKPGALIIVGGDTALGVLTALGTAGIVLGDEPFPGTAAGTLDGGSCSGMPVVTKAGGFGDSGTLSAIVRYLRRE